MARAKNACESNHEKLCKEKYLTTHMTIWYHTFALKLYVYCMYMYRNIPIKGATLIKSPPIV